MTSLLTNNAAMTALTTLKNINQSLDTTSNRVSTGQRVSAASDNAAYWSIATTVRTDNASLGAVKDALGLGSSAVDTAYNGLNSVITDLQNMRAKLQTALTPGVDRTKVQTEIAAIQSKMRATADSSVASGQNWLSVNSATSNKAYQDTQTVVAGFSRAADGSLSFSQINVDVKGIKFYDANGARVDTAATTAQTTATTSLTGTTGFATGNAGGTIDFSGPNEVSLTVAVGGSTATLTLNKATMASAAANLGSVTTNEFVAALNNQIASSALAGKATAGLDTAGRLTFNSTAASAATNLTVTVANPSAAGKKVVDVGYGTKTAGAQAAILVGTTFAASAGNKVITIADGSANPAKTITVDFTSKTIDQVITEMNTTLAAATASTVSASNQGGKIVLTNSVASATSAVTISGADSAAYGFAGTPTVTGTAAGTASSSSAWGTDAAQTMARGLLDSTVGNYDATINGGAAFTISNFDISTLVGTTGDTDLKKILTAVDKVIAKATDSGTKLGANKTQIDGQKNFVDTLMKANDRTIGILVDADVEEESTKLKALQTQQQLAVQALSIANSASQNILSLFR